MSQSIIKMFFVALASIGVCGEPVVGQKASSPNIIFIMVDDLGWADLSCYGRKEWETPQIDRLAAEGCRFTQAYVAAPLCSPSRAAFLSGKHPARLHFTDWLPGYPYHPDSPLKDLQWDKRGLEESELIVAEALAEGGYTSGFVGKWHVGHIPPDRQGFQDTMQVSGNNKIRFYDPGHRFETEVKTDDGLRFIEKNKDRPFFLYFCPNSVHVPIDAAKEKIARHTDAPNPVYAAMIEHVDDSVGRFLDKINELGIEDRTMIILFSDNGGVTHHTRGKSLNPPWTKTPVTSNAPLRGNKGTLYEGGIRVPMIVKWPGTVASGSTCSVPVVETDFYPTFLEAAGLPLRPEQHQDGISILSVLKGGSLPRDTFYWHYPHYSHHQEQFPGGAIRIGDWKLIERFEDDSIELYNLADDIGETNNLASVQPERAAGMLKMLKEWQQHVDAQMPEKKEL